MHNGDVLGDEGRKALDACVKVKIYGKPEIRRYDRKTVVQRLMDCLRYRRPPWGNGSWRRWDIYLEELILPTEFDESGAERTYNIIDIHNALVNCDEISCVEKYPKEGPGSAKMTELIDKRRADIEREMKEATANPDGRHRYSWTVAQHRIRDCYAGVFPGDDWALTEPLKLSYHETPGWKKFTIKDIKKAVVYWDKWSPESPYGRHYRRLDKYPDAGPGSDELKTLIDTHRAELEEEYRQATCNTSAKPHEYSMSEAEHRVRGCFAGSFSHDTDIFPAKKIQSGMSKVYQTYDIFDIKQSLVYFDKEKLFREYPEEEGTECGERKRKIDQERTSIQDEYDKATTNIEVEHGSGFIIDKHFVLTNKHVIETYLDNKEGFKILISNIAIHDELSCEVAEYDPGKDLALLCCPDLNLGQSEIYPLQLSNQLPLPGMQIFCFGYPMSHTGRTALFVHGSVSGFKETLSGHSMAVLNCSLNSGSSGGPVLSWVNGQLKVVGVATQKHFKEILTLEERETIERIRKALQTRAIPDVSDFDLCVNTLPYTGRNCQVSMYLLTLKLYDALETHSQFNLSNALPGGLVIEFIKNTITKYQGAYKEELAEIVKLSQ